MLTLGIETSCDETSCAVLEGLDKVRSNIISSSLFRHKPFGGVVPEIASRHSLEQIDFVFQEALDEAKIKSKDIDLIAVTEGPGLIGSLLVGVSFAKTLAYGLGVPLIGVNHLEAHLSANFIGHKEPAHYVGLLVSGGHTILVYQKKGKSTRLGETVDDAAGEAYDKVAKILGLGFPGGPVIDKLAKEGNPKAFKFTKPKQKGYFDFSFSGIKTAVLYLVEKQDVGAPPRGRPQLLFSGPAQGPAPPLLNSQFVNDVCASFQYAVVAWLVEKTLAAADVKKVADIVVGGGVSANSYLRKRLPEEAAKRGLKVWFPPNRLTTDNAAMIARRGAELFRRGRRSSMKLTGNANLKLG
ncbi:MAG: tRNA (adenosine(37)-N6)-threonylcarbamoyltransferase complex transferase subunit TsaD [Candidatus Omnitrophica bacterium]|nr:tRNA (adenosine(37)-N6)-threonylcarbamoyltransferase complex transferase subunit TsaD [Candidatus Omnitrophota bacterium]